MWRILVGNFEEASLDLAVFMFDFGLSPLQFGLR
jgi:hypothetical protein